MTALMNGTDRGPLHVVAEMHRVSAGLEDKPAALEASSKVFPVGSGRRAKPDVAEGNGNTSGPPEGRGSWSTSELSSIMWCKDSRLTF